MKTQFAALIALATLTAGAMAQNVLLEAHDAKEIVEPFIKVETDNPPAGIIPVEGASRNAYIAVPQGAGNPPKVLGGKAVYQIEVPKDGLYTLWVRAYWDDSCGNSVGVQIDEKPEFMIEDSTYKIWHWVRSPPRLFQLKLKEGAATLTLHNREDGVRIDQILLTPNARFVPVGIEEEW